MVRIWFTCQSSNRTEVDDASGQFRIHHLSNICSDLHVISTASRVAVTDEEKGQGIVVPKTKGRRSVSKRGEGVVMSK